MMEWLVVAAFALDLVLGDPHRMPHPVVLIGAIINRLELLLASFCDNRRFAGVVLAATTLTLSGALVYGVITAARTVHPYLGWIVSVWIAYTTLATRALHKESRLVVRHLENRRIDEARRSLSMIVGRETAGLDEQGILRACIETVAENTSDGVIGPLFYLYIGGPVLAILYKAANTLDSMVGYRDDRYRELGWASARFDDLLNLIPARLTGVLMVMAAFLTGLDGRQALRIMLRDARNHSSPNAGYPEAATAGALGVQLGGPAVYFGVEVDKPTLGDPLQPVSIASYHGAVRLLYVSSLLALGLGFGLLTLISR